MRRLTEQFRAAMRRRDGRGDLNSEIRSMMRAAPIPERLLNFALRLFEDDAPASRKSRQTG